MIRRRKQKKYVKYKIYAFAGVVGFFALLALMIPLRPKESEIEKRKLERFPRPTFETIWNGEFFEGIDKWYADTFPLRDWLISKNMKLHAAYGLQKTQIYGSTQVMASAAGEDKKEKKKDKTSKDGKKQREISQIQEQFGAVYVAEDTAFSLFSFNQDVVDEYIDTLNTFADKVGKDVKVYDMIVPISSGVYLDDDLQKELGSSDQKEAIQYVHDRLDKNVIPVDVFATLENHNNEYLYFRSDHHWTALGAYYAYCEFMDEKKMKPTPLEQYQTMKFEDFLGTMYSYCNQSEALKKNPDYVTAYIPLATNDMQYIDVDGNTVDYEVIADVTQWNEASKYNCFIGGDEPLGWIHNPSKNDGSSVLVVKESYGNAFVPFLVDHYEYVYVVDYRYYPSSLEGLVKEKNIKDVLFLNNVMAVSTDTLVPNITEIVNMEPQIPKQENSDSEQDSSDDGSDSEQDSSDDGSDSGQYSSDDGSDSEQDGSNSE